MEFYIEGTSYIAGQGFVNTGQNPGDLLLYSTGPTVTWRGTSDFYGYIYGPDNPS